MSMEELGFNPITLSSIWDLKPSQKPEIHVDDQTPKTSSRSTSDHAETICGMVAGEHLPPLEDPADRLEEKARVCGTHENSKLPGSTGFNDTGVNEATNNSLLSRSFALDAASPGHLNFVAQGSEEDRIPITAGLSVLSKSEAMELKRVSDGIKNIERYHFIVPPVPADPENKGTKDKRLVCRSSPKPVLTLATRSLSPPLSAVGSPAPKGYLSPDACAGVDDELAVEATKPGEQSKSFLSEGEGTDICKILTDIFDPNDPQFPSSLQHERGHCFSHQARHNVDEPKHNDDMDANSGLEKLDGNQSEKLASEGHAWDLSNDVLVEAGQLPDDLRRLFDLQTDNK
ncbi:hypothetical protein MAJ_11375, partial [Metarhizium majus ARSEF 297]